ncbi:hypothetical protein OROHE_006708 [Orobanche hederae]
MQVNDPPRNSQQSSAEEAEPPECPVCLQPYDAVAAIPRVLTCGHTTCEACLKLLPRLFANTIRCTVCTQLLKLPDSLSSLPKNLDLLYFSSLLQRSCPNEDKRVIPPSSPAEFGGSRLHLQDCVSIGETDPDNDIGVLGGKVLRSFESDRVMGCVLREKEDVGLIKVGIFIESEAASKLIEPSYESRILTVLWGMKEDERDKLGVFICATFRVSNVGKAYEFWRHNEDACIYIVCEKLASPNFIDCVFKREKDDEKEGLSDDEMSFLGMVGMEICEILRRLHLEGLTVGYLCLNCLGFDDFGCVCVDISEEGLQSPEVLLQLIVNEGFELNSLNVYKVGPVSDDWSVASLLVWVIVGSSFVEEMESFLNPVIDSVKNEKDCDYSGLSLRLNPENRPTEAEDGVKEEEGNNGDDLKLKIEGDVVDGLSRGRFKCLEMEGHFGGFLFSSSYDKIVNVWSLQDFAHVHSFNGHKHKVMSVIFVDGERPLCISGDNESAITICIWEAKSPFPEVPMKKFQEEKDWRYSGIHAMANSGTEYLYTGGGDRLVKAWSLQDHTLVCAMSGHKSVVSSLIVYNSVLYS